MTPRRKARPQTSVAKLAVVSPDLSPARARRRRALKTFCWGVAILVAAGLLYALLTPRQLDQPPPPAPLHFFNDYAEMVTPQFAAGKDFWVQISRQAQFVTVIYPRSPEGSVDEFTSRAANSWKIGQAGVNNGLILFVFRDERTMRLEVAYGLEGTLTDLESRRILANIVAPLFARGDYEGGFDAGVEAILADLKSVDDTAPRRSPSLWRYMVSGARDLPRIARILWARFLSESTSGRVAMCVFGSVFAGILIAGLVPLIESLPAFLLLPWRLWRSPTLRNLNRLELRQEFGLREFLRRPPLVFGALGRDVEGVDMILGIFGAMRVLIFVLLLLIGMSVMVGGLGHFGGAGATVVWPAR